MFSFLSTPHALGGIKKRKDNNDYHVMINPANIINFRVIQYIITDKRFKPTNGYESLRKDSQKALPPLRVECPKPQPIQ